MIEILALFTQNFFTPAILFFILGLLAGLLKSDLEIPTSISKYLAIYLMLAIGFKGGVALTQTEEINSLVISTIAAGVLISFIIPFIAYFILTNISKIDKITASAVAAHYGSVSVVTFVTAGNFLNNKNINFAGFIVAVLALMEAPAILSGLFLANLNIQSSSITTDKISLKKLLKKIMTSGPILLLMGSFVIGTLTATNGLEKMEGFLITPFQGFLALFLLDMGIAVAKQKKQLKELNFNLAIFAIFMPIIGGVLGVLLAYMIGLDQGTGTIFAVLCSSASYIAVPAAMQIALPEAKAPIYLSMSLGITFPFNIMFGIPLYYSLINLFVN